MTFNNLIDEIYKELKIVPKHEIKVIVMSLFDIIKEHIKEGNDVKIRNFGTFKRREVKPGMFKTADGGKKPYKGFTSIRFKASRNIRDFFQEN